MSRQVNPVEVHVDGSRFTGFYAVQSNMLTVWHAYLGSRTTQIGSAPVQQQVDTLMEEIFRECRHRLTRAAVSSAI
jgi:hypothetical protein